MKHSSGSRQARAVDGHAAHRRASRGIRSRPSTLDGGGSHVQRVRRSPLGVRAGSLIAGLERAVRAAGWRCVLTLREQSFGSSVSGAPRPINSETPGSQAIRETRSSVHGRGHTRPRHPQLKVSAQGFVEWAGLPVPGTRAAIDAGRPCGTHPAGSPRPAWLDAAASLRPRGAFAPLWSRAALARWCGLAFVLWHNCAD